MAFLGFLSKKRLRPVHTTRIACWLLLFGFFSFLNSFTSANTASAAELIMFEERGCEWCETWNEEVGDIYNETETGKSAPLRRVLISDPRPGDLKSIEGIHFTPTFVVIHKGKEIGRILGYPGEGFFWGYLEEIVKKIDGHQRKSSSIQHMKIN
jgi:thioredoxin-related protein